MTSPPNFNAMEEKPSESSLSKMTDFCNATDSCYCGKTLDDFHTIYVPIHGYVSLLVCVLGSMANGLNIIVLTRKEMRSPTNAILTGLAFADLAVMIDYIPYSCIGYILPHLKYPRQQRFTYTWTWFVMFHSIFAQICHTISIWLTVTLAVWRYIAVCYPQRNRIWCGMRTTLIAIATSYVVCPIVAIPTLYLAFSITPITEFLDESGNQIKLNSSINSSEARNVTLYRMLYSELANENPALLNINFWIYGVLIKLIPCVALTILSLLLIGALLEAQRRRKKLTRNSSHMKQIIDGKAVEKSRKNSKSLEKAKQTDRTTKMLLAVLLLFLITEFPQGILGLLSALLGKKFFSQCYLKLGELMDILALINSGINFILYCSMSRQFRSTFKLLFRPKFLDKWIPIARDIDDASRIGRTDVGREKDDLITQVTEVVRLKQCVVSSDVETLMEKLVTCDVLNKFIWTGKSHINRELTKHIFSDLYGFISTSLTSLTSGGNNKTHP